VRRLLLLLGLAVVLAGCGGGEEVSPLPETIEGGTTPAATTTTDGTETGTETEGEGTETDKGKPEGSDTMGGTSEKPPAKGDKAAGKQVFASAGCGSCHAFSAAGSNGQIGPNLDKSLAGKDADYIRESILDPSAEIAEGFGPGIMPENYDDDLSDKQVEDLVAFLSPKS